MIRRLTPVAALLAATLLASCGGRGGTLPAGTSGPGGGGSAPLTNGKTTATFKITVPKATASSTARAPKYVSPATTQLTLTISQSGTPVSGYNNVNVPLTPTSNGCSSTLAGTQCQLQVTLAPGSYTATIATADVNSTALSAASNVPFTVTAGSANQIALTLSGIPYQLAVSPGAYAVHGTQNEGLVLYGSAAQKLVVNALDADGNTIVGPGSPTYTLSVVAGSGWATATPAPTSPNTFTVTPPGTNKSFATVAVTANYSDTTCATAGAVCSVQFGIKNDIQTLYVLDHGTPAVAGYQLPVTSASTPSVAAFNGGKFTDGWAIAIDPNNDVFVADPSPGGQTAGTNSVYEYSASGAFVTTISSGVSDPWSLTFDNLGDLFVANLQDPTTFNCTTGCNVTEYQPPYTASPITLSNNTSGSAFASPVGATVIDPQGNLFVETENTLYEFQPPFANGNNASAQYSIGDYGSMIAMDQFASLYITDTSNNLHKLTAATSYNWSSGPTVFSSSSPGPTPMGITIDASGDAFVAICGTCGGGGSDAINEYSPSGSLLASISSGLNDPYTVAIDGAGNLYVANAPKSVGGSGNGSVTVYSPPFSSSSTPVATLTDSSVNTPLGFAITP